MFGFGLGLNKGNSPPTALQRLIKSSSFLITGKDQVNTPFTNPWIDQVGKVGKNILDPWTFRKAQNATFGEDTGRKIVTFNNTFDACFDFAFSEGVKTLSFQAKSTQYIRCQFKYVDDTVQTLGTFVDPTGYQTFVFTTNGKALKQINLYGSGGATISIDLNTAQLEPGSVQTAYEPYGKANVLLQGFAGTTSDGWVVETAPNGKQVVGCKGDALDSVGIMGANAPNPTSGDFGFGFVVKTGTNKVKYWTVRGDTSDATTQYGFKMDASGNLFVILNGTSIQISTALTVGWHKVWLERIGTTLKAFIDGVETYSGTHSTTLTTRANAVIFASPTSATTYTGFSNDILFEYVYDNSEIAKGKINFDKQVAQAYGL